MKQVFYNYLINGNEFVYYLFIFFIIIVLIITSLLVIKGIKNVHK